jgi:hypothetical protein
MDRSSCAYPHRSHRHVSPRWRQGWHGHGKETSHPAYIQHSIAALFTGKRLEAAKFAKHPDVASTIVVTPSKVMSTTIVTDVNVVVSMTTVTVSSAQKTVVVTKTVSEQMPFAGCVADGGGGCWGAGVESRISVVASGK